MELKLSCKGCGKSLNYEEAPEAKHWNEQIYNVERCSCTPWQTEEEIKNEAIKADVEKLKKLLKAIKESKNTEAYINTIYHIIAIDGEIPTVKEVERELWN